MALGESPVPPGIQRHINLGRYREAADALAKLCAHRPSAPMLIALASTRLLLGECAAAKNDITKVVEANPDRWEARFLLARLRAALDERDEAIADFRAALDLHLAASAAKPVAPVPVHYALHSLEQLAYIEQAEGRPPGSLLPITGAEREALRRQLNQTLDKAGVVVPAVNLGGELGRTLAEPPLVLQDEPAPATCLSPRNDWSDTARAFSAQGGVASVDHLLTPEALAQLQRFCLRSTAWRQPNRHGYVGGLAEHGMFNRLILQLADELKRAVPELLGGHHMTYWWGFVYQHQRPGTSIHADQSDISLNLWLTPDSANLDPESGGLDIWTREPPADWTFAEYNSGDYRIRAFLNQSGAPKITYAYRENRALFFKGTLFHETAPCRFAEGFENRRRNLTMLFRKSAA
jgi:hypothetical protein